MQTTTVIRKPVQSPQAKHWIVVINNYTPEQILLFNQPGHFKYSVFGKEVGDNGTPHLQGYVMCHTQKRLSAMKKLFPGAHLEIKSLHATPKRASDYCKKGEQPKPDWELHHENSLLFGLNADFTELGEVPLAQTEAASFKNQEIYDQALLYAKSGQFDEINSKVLISHYNTLKKIASDNAVVPEDLQWEDNLPPNEWHHGPTGTGKSRAARAQNPNAYIKMCNKWWENYNYEDTVLLEDIGLTHLYLGDHIKIWADRYGFRSEVKCSSTVLRPKKIVITSNYHPSDLWTDKAVLEPILRRFKIIEYKKESLTSQVFRGIVEEEEELQRPKAILREDDEGLDECLLCSHKECICSQDSQ